MINTKQGTVAWSPKATETFAKDPMQTMSATDREKALNGQENVGDVLNKVADANYVDPEKAARKTGNSALDKDAFLKLMLAQMKYQDPTNPMQNHEMAAQLAQFTSLEQLNNINSTLTGMSKSQSPQTNYQALNFIGKRVSGDSSKVSRIAGDTNHEFHFDLSGESSQADIKVLDAEGNCVRKLTMTNAKKGSNSITWNGMNEDGSSARPGDYHFEIEAKGTNGSKLFAKTEFSGKITGLNYTSTGPVLLVGQQAIRMQDVKKIEEAPAMGEQGAPAMPMQNVPLGAAASPVMPSGAMGLPPGMSAGGMGMQGALGAAMGGLAPSSSVLPSSAQMQAMAQQMAPNLQLSRPAERAPVPAKDPLNRNQMVQNVAMSQAVLDQVNKAKSVGFVDGNKGDKN